MTKYLYILLILLTACEKEFTEPEIKAELKTTSYIQPLIDNANVGDVVNIPAGVYTESFILRDGVDINFADGAIVQNAGTVFSDNGAVNCKVLGRGEFINTGVTSNQHTINLLGNGNIEIYYKKIENLSVNYAGVNIRSGQLYLEGDLIEADGMGIWQEGFSNVIWRGTIFSKNDYGILAAGGGVWIDSAGYGQWNGYYKTPAFDGIGNITSTGNSAFHSSSHYDNFNIFSGYALAVGTYGCTAYGFEMSRGTCYLHDATFEAQKIQANSDDTDAASIYSGDTLYLDNVTFLAADPEAYSMDNQGNPVHALIYIETPCYGNKPYETEPPMNIVEGAELFYLLGEPITNLTGEYNGKGKYKTVTLTWEDGSPDFTINKEGSYLATTSNRIYIDTLPNAGFQQIEYTVSDALSSQTIIVLK